MPATLSRPLPPELLAAVERHWGFTSLRPLQERAIAAVLAGRDSLVVLPTGGGKSLCYQAPAVLRGDTTVEVLPIPRNAHTIPPARSPGGITHEAPSLLVSSLEQA